MFGASSSSEIFKFNCRRMGQGPQSLFPSVLFCDFAGSWLGKKDTAPGWSPWSQQHPALLQFQTCSGFAGDERSKQGKGPTVVMTTTWNAVMVLGPMGAAQGGGQIMLSTKSKREDGGLGPPWLVVSQAAALAAVLQTQGDIWTLLSTCRGQVTSRSFFTKIQPPARTKIYQFPSHQANSNSEAVPAEQPSNGVTRDSLELSHRAGSATPGTTDP